MLILSAAQIRAIEDSANKSGLSYQTMMEKAGSGCAEFILKNFKNSESVTVLVGKGKNGGDGFVIARVLSQAGKKVSVIKLFDTDSDPLSEKMKSCLPDNVELIYYSDSQSKIMSLIQKTDIIVDAVFGIGFFGELPEHIKEVFLACRESNAKKVAIDIPSGLSVNNTDLSFCFKADFTLSMLAYKKEHIYKPFSSLCGETHIISIGIKITSSHTLNAVTKQQVKQVFPERKYNSHKGSFGNALIIAGSKKCPGAAIMATRGALNTGAGLVTLGFPENCYTAVTSQLSECVFLPLECSPNGSLSKNNCQWLEENCNKFSAIAVGCGSGVTNGTEKTVYSLIKNYKGLLLIDADGINIVSQNINILKEAVGTVCLTPHPAEMSRLTGIPTKEINLHREEIASLFAKQFNCFVLLKGANTVVASPDGKVYINPTGNSALSRGGSGDLLTGIAVSLMAQGNSPLNSLTAAAYLHGLAGEIAGKKYTQYAATVERITDSLADALSQIIE